jgi:hypothetical protein
MKKEDLYRLIEFEKILIGSLLKDIVDESTIQIVSATICFNNGIETVIIQLV